MQDNPTTFAKLPRAARRTDKAKKVPWTVEELGRWLVVALRDRFGAMWLLAATCGLRRSELAGVSRLLLDLDAGLLHLHDTRVVVNGRAQDSDGKSEAGWRTVSLDPYTVSELETYLKMLGEERKGFGPTYPTHGKLMVWEDGKQLHPDTITRRFNRLVDEARVPQIELHDIRHTYITIARDHGVNRKILSGRVGHANETVTDTIYTHETPGADRKVAKKMGKVIKKAVEKAS
jgi:integrase